MDDYTASIKPIRGDRIETVRGTPMKNSKYGKRHQKSAEGGCFTSVNGWYGVYQWARWISLLLLRAGCNGREDIFALFDKKWLDGSPGDGD